MLAVLSTVASLEVKVVNVVAAAVEIRMEGEGQREHGGGCSETATSDTRWGKPKKKKNVVRCLLFFLLFTCKSVEAERTKTAGSACHSNCFGRLKEA